MSADIAQQTWKSKLPPAMSEGSTGAVWYHRHELASIPGIAYRARRQVAELTWGQHPYVLLRISAGSMIRSFSTADCSGSCSACTGRKWLVAWHALCQYIGTAWRVHRKTGTLEVACRSTGSDSSYLSSGHRIAHRLAAYPPSHGRRDVPIPSKE
eukprot:3215094-Rhodomonas_salina.1